MTLFAQLLLILTSIAPIGLVYAGVLVDKEKWNLATFLAGLAIALALLCKLLLLGVARTERAIPRLIQDAEPKEGDALAFLVAYALPLLGLQDSAPGGLIGITVFSCTVAVVLWQQQIFHVNPVVVLLGYRFFSAKNDKGAQVLIISQSTCVAPGVLPLVRISDYLWFEVPTREKSTENVDVRDISNHSTGYVDSLDPP